MGAPTNLEDLYREAKVDLVQAEPSTAVKWAFLAARQAGRRAVAEQHMKELAEERAYVRCNARVMRDRPDLSGAGQEAAKMQAEEYLFANEPEAAREQQIEVELCDATAMADAASAIRDLLAQRTAAMQARPPLRTVQGGKQ